VRTLEQFVNDRLKSSFDEFQQSSIGTNITELDQYEKTLIYHYTIGGYEDLNENLRDNKDDEYEVHLNNALEKLPDFKDLVFRGRKLTLKQLQIYKDAEKNNTDIIYKSFLSTSTSSAVANLFGNTIFIIKSKTGKNIEALSYYGINSQNEREVLFKSKTKFKVLEIKKVNDYFEITLKETT